MPDATNRQADDFRDVCFVIMPFGKKKVGNGLLGKKVDFDAVYDAVFEPAVSVVELPAAEGGGHLRPVRTDRDFFSGHISQAMFEYIEYARFAVADITAINANVFYELGARHRAHESGTAIFHQSRAPIPFDINQIKAFPYAIDPADRVEESRQLVTRVLTESLGQNAWDSPIMLALRAQHEAGMTLQEVLRDAENHLREGDFEAAQKCWLEAAKLDPKNPRHDLKASAQAKAGGDWDVAIGLLHSALAKEAGFGPPRAESSYSDAYRELGVAQNKRDRTIIPNAGEESLRRAVHYAPRDYDAWASLGGVLRRAGRLEEAVDAYEKALSVSDGHPYPLLMMLKLRAARDGKWELFEADRAMLARAEGFRAAQAKNDPPIDVPWCYFDLAEIQLYTGRSGAALETVQKAPSPETRGWMLETYLDALDLIPDPEAVPGLNDLKEMVRKREEDARVSAP